MDWPKPDNPLAMRLDQFGSCWLELRGCCSRAVYYPLPLLAEKQAGAVLLGEVLPRLRCEACGGKPSILALVQRVDGQHFVLPVGWCIVVAE
jgi:hypothetical protein